MTLPIKKAVIEICGSCNYKCTFCPHSFEKGREKAFKRMANFQTFLKILDQLQDSHVDEIYIEGSGEPTMNKKLPEFIKAGVDKGFKMSFITNGFWFKDDLMKRCIDAGVNFVRISVTGYNRETYHERMSEDAFYQVRDQANAAIEYSGNTITIGSYHLILDNNNQDWEVEQYRKNWIDHVPGLRASIWRMHNWSGQYDDITWRENNKHRRRSCGRPFSPDLIVRAGGNDGKHAAVVPCCIVLGQDSKAVLGHLSENTIEEVWFGKEYEHLREMHRQHRFDEIDYCKGCDMLYETPEALVWSNFDTDYNKLTGASFTMNDFRI